MPLFLFPAKNNVKVANEMKQTKTIWSSIGLLTGVVIANLALVRGPWQLPLLIGTFAVWGLWLLWTQVLPFHRTLQAQRRQERAESFNRSLAQTLLHHVNYRVSACLKAGYPDARWEWMMRDPALFVAQGGTGRIRVYGVPDYEFADVTVDQNGKLSCFRFNQLPPFLSRKTKTAPIALGAVLCGGNMKKDAPSAPSRCRFHL